MKLPVYSGRNENLAPTYMPLYRFQSRRLLGPGLLEEEKKWKKG